MATNTRTSSEASAKVDGTTVEVRRTTTVPPNVSVRHFDELDERVQQLLAEFDGDRTRVPVPDTVAETMVDDVVVVFTGYYRLKRR
jgi:hypothetical protein